MRQRRLHGAIAAALDAAAFSIGAGTIAACTVALAALGVMACSDSAPLRHSGFADMTPATQAMQSDDAANPAWLWVEDGRRRFATACERCHTVASMAGVAARYPAWDERSQRPLTLGQRIADCHRRRVAEGGAAATPAAPASAAGPAATSEARLAATSETRLAPESDALLALETFVALQSRGMPIAPPADPRLAPWRERGERFFRLRQGQLDLSCAQCHDQHAGRRLAGSVIPQGHPTGYPIYRLEWQGLGSLQRRVRGCLTGVRAEPLAADADEFTALAVYLAARAAGLAVETPAVRP